MLEALDHIAFAMQKSQLRTQLALANFILVSALSDYVVGQAGKLILFDQGLMLLVEGPKILMELFRPEGAGVIWDGILFEAPVIPAKAGIQSVDSAFLKVCGVDSRFRGNDCNFDRPCFAIDTCTPISLCWPWRLAWHRMPTWIENEKSRKVLCLM